MSASATLPVRACCSSVPVQRFAFYFKSGVTVELLSDVLCLGHSDNEKAINNKTRLDANRSEHPCCLSLLILNACKRFHVDSCRHADRTAKIWKILTNWVCCWYANWLTGHLERIFDMLCDILPLWTRFTLMDYERSITSHPFN